jgi:hypothetical protein
MGFHQGRSSWHTPDPLVRPRDGLAPVERWDVDGLVAQLHAAVDHLAAGAPDAEPEPAVPGRAAVGQALLGRRARRTP